ncbi:oxysterol-binding protein 1-like [Ruditapes philippinarum]|uniref:oxysterol-binding protein 1-like n=1 Tax=Ruditapes philippinarum TaxID=129788 RepID=UPI00295AA146|nr:oxysterol-binding protein 1-like [Ruditapes philippinarum]
MSETKQQQSTYKGWLYKWTNYLKGYQKRWFVLQNGLLSYYRNQAEMTHTCRGTINLATAFITTSDSCTIVISSGGNHTFHLKATSEVDRQKWVTALELAKADAIRMLEPDSDEEEPDKHDIQTTIKSLNSKLEDLNTCNDLIGKHGSALQRALTELEQVEGAPDVSSKIKVINERATMFRITSNAMINACAEFLELAQTDGKRWYKMLEHEYNQKLKLQELLEQLAKDQNTLEIQAKKSMLPVTGENLGMLI